MRGLRRCSLPLALTLALLVTSTRALDESDEIEERNDTFESPAERYSAHSNVGEGYSLADQASDEVNEEEEEEDERIYGGEPAPNPKNIFMVFVNLYYSNETDLKQCGGAMITPKMVVTAAQCFFDRLGNKASLIKVTAGDFASANTKESAVSSFKIHEKFAWNILLHDIALLNLTIALPFSTTGPPPYVLPSKSKLSKIDSLVGQKVTVYGWGGSTNLNEDDSKDLNCPNPVIPPAKFSPGRRRRQIDGTYNMTVMKVIKQSTCRMKLREVFYDLPITSTCADTNRGQKGVCGIDVGSPVILTYQSGNTPVFVGIISHYEDCPTNYPNSFTWLAQYLDWINKNGGPKPPI